MPIAKGARVRQVVPAIEGEVIERRLNEDTAEIEYHVSYTDAQGEPAARWFLESQITEMKEGA